MVRRGLTLVELLIVIAVIAILLALLVPAVMSARSAGRRAQCANNLKELGSAVHQFHSRHNLLPPYWGSMNARPNEPFGGWLLHLLPDLGEQAFFDTLPMPGPGVPTLLTETVSRGQISAGVPASSDFSEGTWVETITGTVVMVGQSFPIVTRTLVGNRGTPARPPMYATSSVVVGTATNRVGYPMGFAEAQSRRSLPVLQCSDDGSTPMNFMRRNRGDTINGVYKPSNWSLTNYMANAHIFLRWEAWGNQGATGGMLGVEVGRRFSGTGAQQNWYLPFRYTDWQMGGRWDPGQSDFQVSPGGGMAFHHGESYRMGTIRRPFTFIKDGLGNTIMFGEGMRRCDAHSGSEGKFRHAFLPTATQPMGEEHTFGIDPGIWFGAQANQFFHGGFGNTIMFQQRPPPEQCNFFRLQANHDVLQVVMCDGSVRGISARVTRREQVDPDVAGRTIGWNTYNPDSLGGRGLSECRNGPCVNAKRPRFWGTTCPHCNQLVVSTHRETLHSPSDGIWDMLMVPNDPVVNILTNTGEIGREK